MKNLKKKLVFGTANFSNTYGINSSNITRKNYSKKIFNLLNKKKIYFIDTAYSYKNAEKTLGKFNLKKFKIISKLPNIQKNHTIDEIENIVTKYVQLSLEKLKIKKFYALLVHNTRELNGKKGAKIFNTLKKLKERHMVDKIGYSIYSPSELDKYFQKFKPDIVQGPLNLLDQRILEGGWLKKLKINGIEFHARSIFLQGLLLKNLRKMPKKFRKYQTIFRKYCTWLQKNNLSSFDACLNFIYSIKFANKVIIGVDNDKQLKKIINFLPDKKKYNFSELKIKKKNLIDPSKW